MTEPLRLLAAACASALLVAACGSDETVSPAGPGADGTGSCLVGDWVIDDAQVNSYYDALAQPDLASQDLALGARPTA